MKKIELRILEWVRQIREQHFEQLKGKSRQEQIAFYRERAREINARLTGRQVVGSKSKQLSA